MITWGKVTIDDYNKTLVRWWEEYNWTPPPLECLPNGYIIFNNETPIYAGFIFYTGTPLAWLEFVIGNKKASVEQKKGGLLKLVDVISTIAKDKGVTSLFVSTNVVFANGLAKTGFNITDKGCIQLIKNL